MKKASVKTRLRRRYAQSGKSNKAIDKTKLAKKVGWRKSRTGRLYHEVRRNRSDKNKKTRL